MKKKEKTSRGIVRGTSSAVMLSILIHAALFLVAGMLVVFTVIRKEEKKFAPPPKAVERPKMKLRKPKVNLKKSSKPKSTTRIVTRQKRETMPNIELPEMSGMGNGLGDGGVGQGFDMMPDLDDISFLGSVQSIGSDLEGTFYDFNRRRDGGPYTIDTHVFITELARFVKSGFDPVKLSRYYSSPKKLYTTAIAVPPIPSPLAPSAFGEPDNRDFCWMVHYKGKLVHKDGIRFRFVGNGDDILVVAINGETVLNGSRGWARANNKWVDCAEWSSTSADNRKWFKCNDYAAVGDLIELEPGVPVDIDVMFAEVPGGGFNVFLCVMEEDVKYEKNSKAEPILPLFKTAELPRMLQEKIYRGMPFAEIGITNNGPIFNDYDSSTPEPAVAAGEASSSDATEGTVDPGLPEPEPSGPRVWTSGNGESFEAELLSVVAGNAVMKTPLGKQKRIPLELFSDKDRSYIELRVPPQLKLDLGKKTRQRPLKWAEGNVRINEYTFTAKVAQTSAGDYRHKLEVEFFAIGSEIGANQYILLDRQKASYIPAETENRSFEFTGRPVDLLEYIAFDQSRGDRYDGYLITVKDQRGEIIAHRSSPLWLFKNLERLKELPTGSFMDNTCTRVWPTPLKPNH